MRKIIDEFKQFALRGNVLDLAIGVIMGGAFSAIINSVVDDLIMPIVSAIFQKNFDNFFIALNGQHYPTLQAAVDANAPIFKYGSFISAVINFFIIALCLFLMVKAINKFFPKKDEAPPRKCPYCIEIIPEEASRCPHCTSILEPAEEKDPPAAS